MRKLSNKVPLPIVKTAIELIDAASLSDAELERQAGLTPGYIYALRTGRTYYPRLDTLQAVLNVIGCKLEITTKIIG